MSAPGPVVYRHAVVASTQDLAHELAEQGAPAGTVVTAEEQTGGRGSRGRAWGSPRGGLWLSVVLRPASAAAVEVLSLRLGLAVAGAVESATAARSLALKWPNDLLLGGRKVGGILCEARWQGDRPEWVVAGIGLNVANRPPVEARHPAAVLADDRPGLTPEQLLEPVAGAVRDAGRRDGALEAAELAELAGRDWLHGRALREPVAGVAAGIAADGRLAVRRGDGRLELVRTGTVVLESI